MIIELEEIFLQFYLLIKEKNDPRAKHYLNVKIRQVSYSTETAGPAKLRDSEDIMSLVTLYN